MENLSKLEAEIKTIEQENLNHKAKLDEARKIYELSTEFLKLKKQELELRKAFETEKQN